MLRCCGLTEVQVRMRSTGVTPPVAVLLCLILLNASVVAADVAVGNVIPRTGVSRVNGAPIAFETTLFEGDQLVTEENGSAMVVIPGGGQIHLGPLSSSSIFRQGTGLSVELISGVARTRSSEASNIVMNARGLIIQAQGDVGYEVGMDGDSILIAARNGDVEVIGTNASITIPAGSVMRFESTTAAIAANSSDGERAFIWTPANAVWVAVLVSIGVAIPVGYLLADILADEAAAEGCRRALLAVSPSIPLTVCDIPTGL